LITLYHERWQAETTYFSIKATMLDGRVLRSRSLPGLDQEVYALLTTYQALIRAAADTAFSATGVLPPAGLVELVGSIGRGVLDTLHPSRHRRRVEVSGGSH
jgi:hypothetical protein